MKTVIGEIRKDSEFGDGDGENRSEVRDDILAVKVIWILHYILEFCSICKKSQSKLR